MASVPPMDRARAVLDAGAASPAGAPAPAIARSWARCRDVGLDPTRRPEGIVIPFEQVRRRRAHHDRLRRLASAQMQLLYEQIAGSNFMIAFADGEGVVLDTLFDRHFGESEAGRAIIPGSMWREADRGTNALGLALVERGPVSVHGREHYFDCHGHLSCMAVPIFDPGEQLVGLLDASCPNEARQQHTHALVRMAAAAVENGLMMPEGGEHLLIALHPRAEYLDTLSAGLLTLTPDGMAVAFNRPARALLAGLDLTPGTAFEQLFDSRLGPALDELRLRGIVRLRDRAGSAVYLTCRRFVAGETPASAPASPSRTPTSPARTADEPSFICADPALRRTIAGLEAATRAGLPVHVHGETGTGKELMAREAHRLSGRKGEFVAVNCGAVPESLFIAELFGHERGAYTGSRSEGAPGLARLADRGTLFLDEVAEIPAPAQSALLRFLDTMEVRAVGAAKATRVDVQLVSATNADLAAAVAARTFRADLYYRLNGFPIHLPPLRNRTDFEDIVRHLLAGEGNTGPIDPALIESLKRQAWPGNIRELKNWIRRSCLGAVPMALPEADGAPSSAEVCAHCAGKTLSRDRCRKIRDAYLATGRNVQVTARLLNISRTTVYKHIDA